MDVRSCHRDRRVSIKTPPPRTATFKGLGVAPVFMPGLISQLGKTSVGAEHSHKKDFKLYGVRELGGVK